MSKVIFLLCLFLLIGCKTLSNSNLTKATVVNPFIDKRFETLGHGPANNDFKNAIIRNDPMTVRHMLKNKSFVKEKMNLLKLPDSELKESTHYNSSYDLLKTAIMGSKSGQIICRDEIVTLLLEAQLPPRPWDLANAALMPCPEMVKIISKKLSKKDISKGIVLFSKKIQEDSKSFTNIFRTNSNTWELVFNKLQELILDLDGDELVQTNEEFTLANAIKSIADKQLHDIKTESQITRTHQHDITEKFKMNFCKKSNLTDILYWMHIRNRQLEQNCIYRLTNPGLLRVAQVIAGGILTEWVQYDAHSPSTVIHFKTPQMYVDQQPVRPMYVKYLGAFKYQTVLGDVKTVNSFEYIEDIKSAANTSF